MDDPDDVETWVVGPLELPGRLVAPKWHTLTRYVMYTKEGLDILDDTGESLNEPEPMLSGKAKNCILPISMITLYSDIEDENDRKSLSHWEKRTEQNVDNYMLLCFKGVVVYPDEREQYIHQSFFDASPTRRPLPVPCAKISHAAPNGWYSKLIDSTLKPANTRDMLWLFSELLRHICYVRGGKVTFNVADPFESNMSIYGHMARFCSKKEY